MAVEHAFLTNMWGDLNFEVPFTQLWKWNWETLTMSTQTFRGKILRAQRNLVVVLMVSFLGGIVYGRWNNFSLRFWSRDLSTLPKFHILVTPFKTECTKKLFITRLLSFELWKGGSGNEFGLKKTCERLLLSCYDPSIVPKSPNKIEVQGDISDAFHRSINLCCFSHLNNTW